jgi:PIN domain nuclease of toxin-antitoxin system
MQLLLDTCALLWVSDNAPLSDSAVDAIDRAADQGEFLLVSPMTAWEIGLLVFRGRLALPMSPPSWFDQLLRAPNVRLTDLSITVLIASSFLPGQPPRDPADRIVIATARELGLTLVTRDRRILDYGEAGHVLTLMC